MVDVGGRWAVTGATVRGSAHESSGRPNQDAIGWHADERIVAVAVADGHGSARHIRSEVGSRLAVEAGLSMLRSFEAASVADADEVAFRLRHVVVPSLVERWRGAVEEDVSGHTGSDVWVAYGTTLLLAAVAGPWLLTLQVGDGDIVVVGADGGEIDIPLPNRGVSTNETESMCMVDAIDRVRVACRDLRTSPAVLVFCATDGFGDAIADAGWRDPVGRDLAAHLSQSGPAEIERRLPGWLEGPAQVAGDDTTMAVLMLSG